MAATRTSVFRFADVEVREREFTLVKAGVAQAVEPKAFRVLLILLAISLSSTKNQKENSNRQ
jgi:eukaryotic-like serine/threonine-protein kinase